MTDRERRKRKAERAAASTLEREVQENKWPRVAIEQFFLDKGFVPVSPDNIATHALATPLLLGSMTWKDTVGKDHCGFVISTREHLQSISRVSNKEYIMLCGDGTFKSVLQGWCIIIVGFLSKHYSRTTEAGGMPGGIEVLHQL